jgi:hypothetical protein
MGSGPSSGWAPDFNYAAPGTTGGLQQTIPQNPVYTGGNPSDFNYAAPGSTGGPQHTIPGGQSTFWDRLMDAIDKGTLLPKTSMPGTTIGARAGQTAPALPAPPVFPPGQRPPGMGAYFQALQNPPTGGGGNLMAQYAALQRLMQGG